MKFNQLKEINDNLITKFGGQPIGLTEEQWPISEAWDNRKMMFVGQIIIEKNMLGNENELIAYIFITHPESYKDDFFDPDALDWNSGENAVIIQPLEKTYNKKTILNGPVIFDKDNNRLEYVPILQEGYDPTFISSEEFTKLNRKQQDKYFFEIDTNKIGGTPNFFRGDEWPEGEWLLLLQLKCNSLPFILSFGGMAVLYVFISRDFKRAGLLVQS